MWSIFFLMKFSMDSHGKQCTCGAHRSTPSVHQTLEEMDFERGTSPACMFMYIIMSPHICILEDVNCLFVGIWSAAMDGDVERVRTFIKKGIDPNIRDQASYTALVCSFYNSLLMQTLLIVLIS